MTDPFNGFTIALTIAFVMFAMIVLINKTGLLYCRFCGGRVGKHSTNCPKRTTGL